ncbi:MAG: hypothetical protein Q4Q53_07015 [Methanocorpusculum sp.]|nr:hypothetical protein [Methanocorpusculum sp.]
MSDDTAIINSQSSDLTNKFDYAELEPEQKLEFVLPFEYMISSSKGKFLIPSDKRQFITLIDRIVDLKKDGKTVYTVEVSADHETPRQLFADIEPYLRGAEEPDKVDWIRRKFCGNNNEIPPWERTAPARDYRKIPLDEVIYSLNDDGNATRFEAEAKGYLINDITKSKQDGNGWYAWVNDNHWEPAGDKLGKAERFIGQTIEKEFEYWRRIYEKESEKGDNADKGLLKKLASFVPAFMSHLTQSKNQGRQRAMLEMAAKSTMQADLDSNTDYGILAFKNGAIDCKTGEFYPIWRCNELKTRYPLTYVNASYTEGARPNKFLKHVKTIFTDNTTQGLSKEEINEKAWKIGFYFLRMLGYILINGNPEQLFVFWWGEGANGKSKTIDVLSDILGVQHVDAPIDEIAAGQEGRPKPKVAIGLDKRLLTFSEASSSEGNANSSGKISLALVKKLSGEHKTADFRRMYHEGMSVVINCLPVGITNKLPRFDGELDYSALRRLITIPFFHKFEGKERKENIVEELLTERNEIFSLMVDEMKEYLNHGLLPLPEECQAAQNELLAGYEYNQFVTSQFEKTDGIKPEDRTNRETIKTLFMEWCDENGIDIDTTMKLSGEDDFGNPKKKRTLTKAETNRLFNAFRVNKIKGSNSHGIRYLNCKPKK